MLHHGGRSFFGDEENCCSDRLTPSISCGFVRSMDRVRLFTLQENMLWNHGDQVMGYDHPRHFEWNALAACRFAAGRVQTGENITALQLSLHDRGWRASDKRVFRPSSRNVFGIFRYRFVGCKYGFDGESRSIQQFTLV